VIRDAWNNRRGGDGDRIKQSEVADLAGKFYGDPAPFAGSNVSKWLGGQEPRFTVGVALCHALGVDPIDVARRVAAKRRGDGGPAAKRSTGLPPAPLPERELTADAGKRSAGRRRASGR